MILLGDPAWRLPDGTGCELHFLLNGVTVAVVHGDLVKNTKVSKASLGTTVAVIHLKGRKGSGFGRLPDNAQIALWVHHPEVEKARLAVVQIDYWKHDFDADTESVEIHGRGALAAMIDTRWQVLFQGDLEELVARACSATPASIEGLARRQVSAYVDSPSVYSALRLMGVSLGFVIHENFEEWGVICSSVEKAMEQMKARPVTTIGPDQILTGTYKRGAPVRRRNDT